MRTASGGQTGDVAAKTGEWGGKGIIKPVDGMPAIEKRHPARLHILQFLEKEATCWHMSTEYGREIPEELTVWSL